MMKRNPEFCPYCGHVILDNNQKYCDYCGYEIEKEEVSDRKTGSGGCLSSLLTILFLIGIIVYFVSKH